MNTSVNFEKYLQELSREHLLAQIGFDTAEIEPSKVCYKSLSCNVRSDWLSWWWRGRSSCRLGPWLGKTHLAFPRRVLLSQRCQMIIKTKMKRWVELRLVFIAFAMYFRVNAKALCVESNPCFRQLFLLELWYRSHHLRLHSFGRGVAPLQASTVAQNEPACHNFTNHLWSSRQSHLRGLIL